MRDPATFRELDDLVREADRTGRHRQLADQLVTLAERLPHGDGSMRAEVLMAAAEQLRDSGRPDQGLAAAQAAESDGGSIRYGAGIHLSVALHAAGRDDEARDELAAIRRSRPVHPVIHLIAAGQCEDLGDDGEALRWFTRGLAIMEGRADVDLTVAMLLVGRAGLRERVGLPADDWDETAQRLVDRARSALDGDLADDHEEGCRCDQTQLAAYISVEDDTTMIDLVHV